jgi:hypothetical protein
MVTAGGIIGGPAARLRRTRGTTTRRRDLTFDPPVELIRQRGDRSPRENAVQEGSSRFPGSSVQVLERLVLIEGAAHLFVHGLAPACRSSGRLRPGARAILEKDDQHLSTGVVRKSADLSVRADPLRADDLPPGSDVKPHVLLCLAVLGTSSIKRNCKFDSPSSLGDLTFKSVQAVHRDYPVDRREG